jgi:CheY-like chemotaxis protein
MPTKAKPARKFADEPMAGARVLVVDDHSFTIGLIKDVLYASGAAEVYSALDGAEAIAMLRACQPHMVVGDWRMPGLDGLAFTEIVRRAAIKLDARIPDPQVPIVLLSAHASAKALETARRAGVSEVVIKPFTIAALLKRLVTSMTQSRGFVVCESYVGPDRRWCERADGKSGRRAGDGVKAVEAMLGDSSMLVRLQTELDSLQPRSLRKLTCAVAPRQPTVSTSVSTPT